MSKFENYSNKELFVDWNETMWEIDNLAETIAERLLSDEQLRRREEERSDLQQRIALLNQEFKRRGLDTPED